MTVGKLLEKAIESERQNRMDDAERLYTEVVEKDPTNFDGLHGSGVICYPQGRLEDAEGWIQKAIEQNQNQLTLKITLAAYFWRFSSMSVPSSIIDNPYGGHTLATMIPDMEALVGNTIARILTDKGYRGHNAPPDYKFRVFISGQKRGVTPSTAWAATISGSVGATLPTPSSPPPATTSAA